MTPTVEAIILGITQGATEFIPVSSSGHLILVDRFLSFSTGGFIFDAILNIGTLAALFLYFKKEVWHFVKSVVNPSEHGRLGWYVLAGTVPAAIAGWYLQDLAETTFRSVYLVITMLATVGALMLFVDRRVGERNLKDLSVKDALVVGFAQILALVPGTSRSGITIIAGLSQKLSRETAAKFSFFLAMPILSGGVAKVIAMPGTIEQVGLTPMVFAAGVVAAFISGYLAIDFLLKYLITNNLAVFAWYRIGLAAIILLITVI